MIFANPTHIELSVIESLIKSKLIDETWFYADEWGLPELFFDYCDFRMDPTWHEFENVEYSIEPTDENEGVKFLTTDFTAILKKIKIADQATRF